MGDREHALALAERARTLFGKVTMQYVRILGEAGYIDEAIAGWAKMKKILPTANVKARQDSYQMIYGTEEAVEGLTGGFRKAGIVD